MNFRVLRPRVYTDLSTERMNIVEMSRKPARTRGMERGVKTPLAICQELLSCFYRVAVARSHIKQINLVRGSVYLRPSAFQKLTRPSQWLVPPTIWRRIHRLCSSFILIRRLNENEVAVIAVPGETDSLNRDDLKNPARPPGGRLPFTFLSHPRSPFSSFFSSFQLEDLFA